MLDGVQALHCRSPLSLSPNNTLGNEAYVLRVCLKPMVHLFST